MVAAADSAGVGLANEIADAEGTLLVDVETDDAEVLGLNELFEQGCCGLIHLEHGILLQLRPLDQDVETQEVQAHP